MTKHEFKNQIPKMDKCQLLKIGFDYNPKIRECFRPISMWIPKELYDSIPDGFPVYCWKSGETELFDREKHPRKVEGAESTNHLPYAVQRKDIKCKN